ncbi:MAG: Chromate resistance protein ChrB [Trebonia sp.]
MVPRRVTARYRTVRGRDPFGTRQAEAAAAALARYRRSLNEYGTRVYAADSHS